MGLRKRTWTIPIPQDAEHITVKGKPHVSFRDESGKLRKAPLTKKGDRVRLKSKEWHGYHRDRVGIVHEWKLGTDREAAETLFNEKRKAIERGEVHLTDPHGEHRRRPLADHADDFERYLCGKNNSPKHVTQTTARVKAVLIGCRFTLWADLSPSSLVDWLADERRCRSAEHPHQQLLSPRL